MPLFNRRREQEAQAEAAAKGEVLPLSTVFTNETRIRLLYAITDSAPDGIGMRGGMYRQPDGDIQMSFMRDVLRREWGVITLAGHQAGGDDLKDFIAGRADDRQMLDVIESFYEAFVQMRQREFLRDYEGHAEADTFRNRVNQILDEDGMGFQIVGTRLVTRESMAMHANVVRPALSLLHGKRELANVETAYQKALEELRPDGDPGDAITDAATALQEMLQAVGARGNSLGPLLNDARGRGILGPHDPKLVEGMAKFVDWVSADRSERGDAHGVRDANRADAWLAVNVTGALILRLEASMP